MKITVTLIWLFYTLFIGYAVGAGILFHSPRSDSGAPEFRLGQIVIRD